VGRRSSIVEVQRIQGPTFNSKEAAEEHGLKLCKQWINRYDSTKAGFMIKVTGDILGGAKPKPTAKIKGVSKTDREGGLKKRPSRRRKKRLVQRGETTE